MRRLDPERLPQHVDRLYRAAWALCGSPTEAEDLVQETFARVLARPRLLRDGDELAYLMRALRNTFLIQVRTASRRPRSAGTPIDELELPDRRSGESPEAAVLAREVYAAIAALPEDRRMAVVAVDIVGLSYREAAHLLGTEEKTIATRVFRGRARAAELLSTGEDGPHRDQETTRGPGAREGRGASGSQVS